MKKKYGPDLVVGLDCSTTAVKAIAWDAGGRPAAFSRVPLTTATPFPGFFEQHADEWWEASGRALRLLTSQVNPQRIRAISISHQRESFVPVGKAGHPLRPAILWQDRRGQELLPELSTMLDPANFHQRTGKPLTANLAPSKLEWLRRNEPEIFSDTQSWLDTQAFLVERLTGRRCTSHGSADPLGLFNLSAKNWDEVTLDILKIHHDSMPQPEPCGTILGTITPHAAEWTGLGAHTLVVAGMGDGQCAILGAGALSHGQVSLSLGTSIIGGVITPGFLISPAFRTLSGPGTTFVLETVLLSGLQITDWLAKDILGGADLKTLEAEAASIPPGSQGLLLLPYWNGAMNPYWNPAASGVLVGLRAHHHPAHLFRAAMEGIAFEIRLHIEGLERETKIPVNELIASGGGTANRTWLQILADVCGKAVECRDIQEASALGAGMLAAAAVKWYPDELHACQAMSASPKVHVAPHSETHLKYSTIYQQVYQLLYPALRTTMDTLNHLDG